MNHLESIGLVQLNNLTGFVQLKLPKQFVVHYYGKPLSLEMAKDADNDLNLGKVLLTKTGAELAPICGSKPVDGFWEYVQNKWGPHLPKKETEQGAAPSGGAATPNGNPGVTEGPPSVS